MAIDKLPDKFKLLEITMDDRTESTIHLDTAVKVMAKINELIDKVNQLDERPRLEFDYEEEEGEEELPVQTFYKKEWIGKVCKFWDDPKYPQCCKYYVLENIYEDDESPFYVAEGGVDIGFRYCMPVTKDEIVSEEDEVKSWVNGVPDCGGQQ